jgi:hypothetical protein
MIEKWTVKQFFLVMLLCLVAMAACGVYSIFNEVESWKFIFKPMQIILSISGFILIIDLLRDKSK